MRNIVSHITNPANDKLVIVALDEPGPGGASHVYAISGMDLTGNSAAMSSPEPEDEQAATIIFQCGGIAEHGVNGITQEALLAIVADRLDSFQKGPFPCRENDDALRHVEAALGILHERTLARMARGVEGKTEA